MDNYYCNVCDIKNILPDHNNSDEHRYHFILWSWNEYRKPLVKDRHGITVDIDKVCEKKICITRNYKAKKGTYVFEISTNKFLLNNNEILFKCIVKNDSRARILIVKANILYDSVYFNFINPIGSGKDDSVIALDPQASYCFEIKFSLEDVVNSTIKIPVVFTFQTCKEKPDVFTIARSIVVKINDGDNEVTDKGKSPFTRRPWFQISQIIPPSQKMKYKEYFTIPEPYQKVIKMGLKEVNYDKKDYEAFLHLNDLASQGLNSDNYAAFGHLLLWLDEIGESLKLQCYNMEKIAITVNENNLLVIEVPGLAEKRPSVLKNDLIDIRQHEGTIVYQGLVCRIDAKEIYIKNVDQGFVKMIKNNPDLLFDVRFNFQRLSQERMHSGINRVVIKGLLSCLFPNPNQLQLYVAGYHTLYNTTFYNESVRNNLEQRTAVLNILNKTSKGAPYIVYGPPGTGKTVTIVEAIVQILKQTQNKILVCAPSNAACDTISVKLIEYCNKHDLLRLHSDSRNVQDLPLDMKDKLLSFSNFDGGSFRKVNVEEACNYRIVITTLVHAGKLDRLNLFKPDCVFIDEAAQASEPETCVAIGFLSNGGTLVLAGDHKQLGPVVSSNVAEKYGLSKSLLERLSSENEVYKEKNPYFMTMLVRNFRSHSDILHIPNKFFYENLLKPMSIKAEKDPLSDIAIYPLTLGSMPKKYRNCKGKAVEFCGIISKEKTDGRSPSFYNDDELKMVTKYVKALLEKTNLIGEHKVKEEDIGIIAPYIKQVYKIKNDLKYKNLEHVEVGTTETFQGREKRIIIISTVRAQRHLLKHDRKFNLGFVRNEKRFNVCITRAMSKLIVIGCPTLLDTDKKWRSFMEHCETYRTYFGATNQKRTGQFRKDVIKRVAGIKPDTQFKGNH